MIQLFQTEELQNINNVTFKKNIINTIKTALNWFIFTSLTIRGLVSASPQGGSV